MLLLRTAASSCPRFPFKMTEQIDLLEFGQCGNCYCILPGKCSEVVCYPSLLSREKKAGALQIPPVLEPQELRPDFV